MRTKKIKSFTKEVTIGEVLNRNFPEDKSVKFVADGDRYTCPKTVVGWDRIDAGVRAIVNADLTEWKSDDGRTGTYNKVTAIAFPQPEQQQKGSGLSRDEYIARQVALKAAVEAKVGGLVAGEVLAAARTFYEWLVDSDAEEDFDAFVEQAKKVLDAEEVSDGDDD